MGKIQQQYTAISRNINCGYPRRYYKLLSTYKHYSIWLWHSQFAMERSNPFLRTVKPSITSGYNSAGYPSGVQLHPISACRITVAGDGPGDGNCTGCTSCGPSCPSGAAAAMETCWASAGKWVFELATINAINGYLFIQVYTYHLPVNPMALFPQKPISEIQKAT